MTDNRDKCCDSMKKTDVTVPRSKSFSIESILSEDHDVRKSERGIYSGCPEVKQGEMCFGRSAGDCRMIDAGDCNGDYMEQSKFLQSDNRGGSDDRDMRLGIVMDSNRNLENCRASSAEDLFQRRFSSEGKIVLYFAIKPKHEQACKSIYIKLNEINYLLFHLFKHLIKLCLKALANFPSDSYLVSSVTIDSYSLLNVSKFKIKLWLCQL